MNREHSRVCNTENIRIQWLVRRIGNDIVFECLCLHRKSISFVFWFVNCESVFHLNMINFQMYVTCNISAVEAKRRSTLSKYYEYFTYFIQILKQNPVIWHFVSLGVLVPTLDLVIDSLLFTLNTFICPSSSSDVSHILQKVKNFTQTRLGEEQQFFMDDIHLMPNSEAEASRYHNFMSLFPFPIFVQ